jgi:hypothetical protein
LIRIYHVAVVEGSQIIPTFSFFGKQPYSSSCMLRLSVSAPRTQSHGTFSQMMIMKPSTDPLSRHQAYSQSIWVQKQLGSVFLQAFQRTVQPCRSLSCHSIPSLRFSAPCMSLGGNIGPPYPEQTKKFNKHYWHQQYNTQVAVQSYQPSRTNCWSIIIFNER